MKSDSELLELGVNLDYPKAVQQVHGDFLNASNALVIMSEKLLKIPDTAKIKKGKRLSFLGFNKSTEGKEYKEKEDISEYSKQCIEYVREYAIKFPLHKFITTNQVKDICNRNGLIYGSVDRFNGFVPDKNLKELEEFMNMYDFSNYWTIDSKTIDLTGYTPKYRRGYSHFFDNSSIDDYIFQGAGDFEDSGFEGFYGKNIFNGELLNLTQGFNGKLHKSKLQICAPLKYMDTSGMIIRDHKVIIDEDPIVMHEVPGGFIIATMWADEQFDPFQEETLRNDSLNN